MDAKTLDIVIEALAATISNLKTELFVKDMEIDRLKAVIEKDAQKRVDWTKEHG